MNEVRLIRRQALQAALEVVQRSEGRDQCVDGILDLLRQHTEAPTNGYADPGKAIEAFLLLGVLNDEHQQTLFRHGLVQSARGKLILTSAGKSLLERLGH